MSDTLPDLEIVEKSQCFPLYTYEEQKEDDLFSLKKTTSFKEQELMKENLRQEGVSNFALEYFKETYPGYSITKKDIFFYIYGILHSSDYRRRFTNNLTKELPRIPRVKTLEDFIAFKEAGKKLSDLHIKFESAKPYPVKFVKGLKKLNAENYFVKKNEISS